MRYLLVLTLLGILLAGCSSRADNSAPGAKATPPSNPNIANVAPEGRLTEVPEEANTPLPAVTANPSPFALTPVQGNTPAASTSKSLSTGSWKTFTSAVLGVRVDYPPDWSAAEEADGATFTSPSGAIIQLKSGPARPAGNEFRIGNEQCTSRTNEHGQTAEVCVDNASFTFTARFDLQKAGSSSGQVILVTKTRAAGEVFEGMFNSLQPAN